MASIDFFSVPTATFRVLFVFVVLKSSAENWDLEASGGGKHGCVLCCDGYIATRSKSSIGRVIGCQIFALPHTNERPDIVREVVSLDERYESIDVRQDFRQVPAQEFSPLCDE
jgi:hypothetical protein